MKLRLALPAFLLIGSVAHAATPQFVNLTQDDVDKLSRDFAANTTLHSVMPPSSLGSIFGFELGAVLGATNSPNVDEISKRVDSSLSVPKIPHAGLAAAVTTPIGVTVEGTYLPKFETSGIKYNQFGLALKWNLTDHIIPLPAVDIALRGFLARSEVQFAQTQTSSGISGSFDVSDSTQVTGLQLLVSPKLPIIEPYIGIGMLSSESTISHSSTVGSIFTNGQSNMKSSPTSAQFLVGLDIRLLILGIGAEYSKQFGNDSLTAKASLKF